MNNITFIETTWPHNSRTDRFKESYKLYNYNISSIGWDRNSKYNGKENEFIKKSSIGYGKPITKLLHLFSFVFFVCKNIKKTNPNIIFASHWDSLIVAFISSLFCDEKPKIIYDCLDMPTSKFRIVRFILIKIDNYFSHKSDLVIFASRFFQSFYSIEHEKSIIFENYPSSVLVNGSECLNDKYAKIKQFKEKYKIISWIGVVRYFETLERLIVATSNIPGYKLVFFGDGPDLIKIKKLVKNKNYTHVEFTGRYESSELSFIYSLSDIVWAAYPTKDFNVRYAISNKYFECNLFGKTPIFSENTAIRKIIKTRNRSVLFVNEESVEDIYLKISQYKEPNFEKYEKCSCWEEEFNKNSERFMLLV
ncbi:glycosyltransferase [Vibrio cyclitrophicus]|uniref:glycosyltransferase n=1 Tax=Vibrio cyclitrophicus TaxID=47951 RepID=UPI000C85A138|nr:glycosyltransferase [Vibrio cyclitrophicus]PME23530.1 hypothetical protein BCV41_20205 [Vibrio cyclitrophicus]